MPEHGPSCWRTEGHHACAVARVEELERQLADYGSTFETWRQVIDVVRRRIARWRREEGGGG